MQCHHIPAKHNLVPVLGKERNTASRLAVNLPPHRRLGLLPLRLVDHDITEHILRNQEGGYSLMVIREGRGDVILVWVRLVSNPIR